MTYEKVEVGLARRQGWPPGPWDDEPDKIEWVNAATALPCRIVRHPILGHLCGYVGLAPDHPWFGLDDEQIYELGDDIDVHWGLSWTGYLDDAKPRLWWVGFDCGHARDLIPAFGERLSLVWPTYYRDQAYVRDHCDRLAEAADLAVSANPPSHLRAMHLVRRFITYLKRLRSDL